MIEDLLEILKRCNTTHGPMVLNYNDRLGFLGKPVICQNVYMDV